MPRLIWVFAGRTLILLVWSCRGSYVFCPMFCNCSIYVTFQYEDIKDTSNSIFFSSILFLITDSSKIIGAYKDHVIFQTFLLWLSINIHEPHHESWENRPHAICEQQRHRSVCAFVGHCLDSIIPIFAKSKLSTPKLVSVAEQAGLSLILLQTLKTVFLVTWLKCIPFYVM